MSKFNHPYRIEAFKQRSMASPKTSDHSPKSQIKNPTPVFHQKSIAKDENLKSRNKFYSSNKDFDEAISRLEINLKS